MAPVSLDIEEATLGTRQGVVSWSMPRQVETIAQATTLEPGGSLLDIGSGAGWPGLRIAQLTGARVILSDITIEGLQVANDANGRHVAAQFDASLMPFPDGVFDAITHSDVLCCLPRKLETLRECRRVMAPHGVMAFGIIATAPGISAERLAELDRVGNEYVYSPRPYAEMLQDAGFDAEFEDVTDEFRHLADKLFRARRSRREELVGLWGAEEAHSMIERSELNRDAADAGDLVRHLVVAKPV